LEPTSADAIAATGGGERGVDVTAIDVPLGSLLQRCDRGEQAPHGVGLPCACLRYEEPIILSDVVDSPSVTDRNDLAPEPFGAPEPTRPSFLVTGDSGC
jgi:hypothetical protein